MIIPSLGGYCCFKTFCWLTHRLTNLLTLAICRGAFAPKNSPEGVFLKKELNTEIKKKNLGSPISYNPRYQENKNENSSTIFEKRRRKNQIKNQENSANDDLAYILNSSIGNKVSTKRVWKQSSNENNSKPMVKTDDEQTEEKDRKESAAGSSGFSIGTEEELVDFLSDFTKNCQQRPRTIKRRPKVQI